MSETNLRAALDGHLSTMTDVPVIAWEGKQFDPTIAVYLHAFLVPAETIAVGMEQGGSDILAGIYQITVNVPKNSDKSVWLAETKKVKDRFVRGTILDVGGTRIVLSKTWSSPAITGDTSYSVPISVRYRAI